mmetsp:Transcript_36495/g.101931  ORF Transcript_36495/g.101931 Transcript_36495/m.101931 type:complete len:208 (+) Transcript_36495:93-716(+)
MTRKGGAPRRGAERRGEPFGARTRRLRVSKARRPRRSWPRGGRRFLRHWGSLQRPASHPCCRSGALRRAHGDAWDWQTDGLHRALGGLLLKRRLQLQRVCEPTTGGGPRGDNEGDPRDREHEAHGLPSQVALLGDGIAEASAAALGIPKSALCGLALVCDRLQGTSEEYPSEEGVREASDEDELLPLRVWIASHARVDESPDCCNDR